jgi:acyl dehydratase
MQQGGIFTNEYDVTDKVYQGFRDIFSDHNPLHTDEEFAKAHGMSERVMYGNILNGFLSHFIGELLPIKNVIIHSQSINFYLPVYLNDKLTLTADLAEVHEAVKAYTFKYTFRNMAGKRVAKGDIQIGLI